MKSRYILILLLLAFAPLRAADYFNVKTFGAKGDGKTIDSPAINRAIEAAAKAGGGTVFLPAGNYACYSIRLQSNITLMLDAGATIVAEFPTEKEGYDAAEANSFDQYQDFGHSHWKNSLIWGINIENITLCGQGTIYGKGLSRGESRLPGVGNKAVSLKLCRNVTMRDLKMLHCGHFALLATGVDNLTIDNLLIDTNRDGLDIDCCRNVRVSNCTVNSPWDDAIVLKASYGLGFFRDTENVTITNCLVSGYDKGSVVNGTFERFEPQAPDQAFTTGRIKLGTESSGGFRNITISNCVFDRCRGLALETVDGGILEDITISNISMRDIVNSPIFLRLGARMRSPQGTPVGKLRRVSIDNVNVYNANSDYPCLISGIPGGYIEDVSVNNMRIVYRGGGTREQAQLIPGEFEKRYPEPLMFGVLPASAFYIRHARNVSLSNIQVSFLSPDFRPSVQMDDVKGATFSEVRINQPDAPDFLKQTNCEKIETFRCGGIKDSYIEKSVSTHEK